MKTQTVTFSKSLTILKCCFAAALIALTINIIGNVGIHQFIINIMDWNTI